MQLLCLQHHPYKNNYNYIGQDLYIYCMQAHLCATISVILSYYYNNVRLILHNYLDRSGFIVYIPVCVFYNIIIS